MANNNNNNNDKVSYDDVFDGKYIPEPFYQIELWGENTKTGDLEMYVELSEQYWEINLPSEEKRIIEHLNDIIDEIKNKGEFIMNTIKENEKEEYNLLLRVILCMDMNNPENYKCKWEKYISDIIEPPPIKSAKKTK